MYQPTEDDRVQALKVLENSYEMYEHSKNEMIKTRQESVDKDGNRIYTDKSIEETLDLMNTMQDDIIQKYVELGGNPEKLKGRITKESVDRRAILDAVKRANEKDNVRAQVAEYGKKMAEVNPEEKPDEPHKQEDALAETAKEYAEPETKVNRKLLDVNFADIKEEAKTIGNAAYDTVKLPSKGECYSNKIAEVEVSYLTAYDENLILSPNLYKNGTFLDHMLKNKVRGINPDALVQGDRDAILIWLRASGYGNEYPIHMIDDKSGKEYDTVVDLSKLEYKKFNLRGDENGFFDFKLPVCGDEIKFRFLTNNDTKKLAEIKEEEEKNIKAFNTRQSIRKIRQYATDENIVRNSMYEKVMSSLDVIETEVFENTKGLLDMEYTNDLTNRLILSTVSVNGNTDRNFINDYILNLNIKDAAAYRKYIIENEPGIDYNIKVERPDSLGGGYQETFLQLDQFIFVLGV